MKNLLLFVIFSTAITTYAGVKYTMRVDYNNLPKFKGANDADNSAGSTSFFASPYNRMNFDGKVGDMEVKVGFDFMGSSATGTPGNGNYTFYSFLNHFYFTQPMGDMFLSLGRLVSPYGGFERVGMDNGDSYKATLANGGSQLANGEATLAFTPPAVPQNQGGFAFGYNFGDSHVRLDVTNESNTTAGTMVRKRTNMGLSYHGAFAEKSVQVKLGYLSGAADTATAGAITQIDQSFMNAGVQATVSDFTITAEHLANSEKSTATNAKANKVTSTYIKADYYAGNIKPFLKYEMSDASAAEDAATPGSYKRTAATLGLEFKPGSEDFRYHVAYSSISDKYGAPVGTPATYTKETVSGSHLMAGVKITADLLK